MTKAIGTKRDTTCSAKYNLGEVSLAFEIGS